MSDIKETCERLTDLLMSKNDAYGNSALEPMNVFSNGSAVDNLCVGS